MRRYPFQHMHMVSIDRSSVDGHLVRPCDFPAATPAPVARHLRPKQETPVLRYPHDVILAVPDRVTSGLRMLPTRTVASQSPEGEGFTDPKGEILKAFLRKIAERTVAGLMIALDARADIFNPAECLNYSGVTRGSENPSGR